MLEGLGWTIHRVWSTAWIRDPVAELASIEASLDLSRSGETLASTSSEVVAPTADSDPRHISRAAAEALTSDRAQGSNLSSNEQQQDEPPLLFEEYEMATLGEVKVGPELQYETSQTMNRLVVKVVEREAPAHIEQIVTRIRDRYGLGRAGHIIRNRIEEAIRETVKRGEVNWLAGKSDQDSTTFLTFVNSGDARARRPHSAGPPRAIEHISIAEIEAGVMLVVEAMFGGEREAVTVETARQFGYQRTGPDISRRIGEAISGLVKDGRLGEAGGMLFVATTAPGTLNRHEASGANQTSHLSAPTTGTRKQQPGSSIGDIRALGLEVIDKRASGGSLWVIAGPDLKDRLVPLGFKFAARGGRATKQRPAWYLPPS